MKRKKKLNKTLYGSKEKKLLDKVNITKNILPYNGNNPGTINKFNKLNNRIKFLSGHMEKKNLMQDNLILPSVIKISDSNLQIKPFWNDKIRKISEKIFLPKDSATKKLKRISSKH